MQVIYLNKNKEEDSRRIDIVDLEIKVNFVLVGDFLAELKRETKGNNVEEGRTNIKNNRRICTRV